MRAVYFAVVVFVCVGIITPQDAPQCDPETINFDVFDQFMNALNQFTFSKTVVTYKCEGQTRHFSLTEDDTWYYRTILYQIHDKKLQSCLLCNVTKPSPNYRETYEIQDNTFENCVDCKNETVPICLNTIRQSMLTDILGIEKIIREHKERECNVPVPEPGTTESPVNYFVG